ncbi:hypothetical protein [Leptospira sp. 'Mane']|uniref:hypothetical protein n=1 Tax=Leptospira sp. 'Mane' TaxID=3387407 RepID=UPI00398B99CE
MSEYLIIFTILILSHSDLKLLYEKVNVKTKTSLERKEFSFPNTQNGFVSLTKKTEELKQNEPTRECLYNVSEDGGGFLGKLANAEKKTLPKNIFELADSCKLTIIKH